MSWRMRGLALLAGTAAVLFVVTPHLAYAEGGGLGPVTFTLSGSRGESLWIYNLSIDRGGITDPEKLFWSYQTDIAWSLYLLMIALAIWIIDWALSFAWVEVIASPLLAIGDGMQQVVTGLGLIPTMLTVAAFVAGMLMLSGRWVQGTWELVMTCVIASLAIGVFAQPVRTVAGPDGLLYGARDGGLQVAAAIMDRSSNQPTSTTNTDQARQRLIAGMVDSLVRMPHQLVNFGQVVDGGPCADAYQTGLTATNGDTEKDDLRTAVTQCEQNLGEFAEKPSPQMWLSAVMISPAAAIFGLMALILAGSIILAGASAIFQGLKAIITLIMGLLPGVGRGSFFMTLADALMSLLVLVFTTVFLALFLSVIQTLFRESTNPPQTFVIIDILLVVGIILYIKNKKRIQRAARDLAGFMAKRPGGGSSARMPDPGSPISVLGGAARGIQTAADLRRLTNHKRSTQRQTGDAQPTPSPLGTSTTTVNSAGPTAAASATTVSSAARRTQQARHAIGAAGEIGLHIAGAVASGGTSTVATVAAAAARVRKAQQIAQTANMARKAITGPKDQRQHALTGLTRHALAAGSRPGRALPSGRSPKALPPAPGGSGPRPLSPPPPTRAEGSPSAPRSTRGIPGAPRALPPSPHRPHGPSGSDGSSLALPSAPPSAATAGDKNSSAPSQAPPATASPALGRVAGSSTPAPPATIVRARLRDNVERVITDGVVVFVDRTD